MELEFRWDRLSDSLREPFVGIAIHTVVNCSCIACESSPIKPREPRLHIGIVPLDKNLDCQSAWFNYSSKKWSSWGALCLALQKLQLTVGASSLQDVLQRLQSTVLQWESITVVKFIERETGMKAPSKLPEALQKKETWIPVRVVKIQELEFSIRDDLRELVEQKKLSIETIKEYARQKWQEHLRELEKRKRQIESVETVETIEFDMTQF